jgi:hypothetical protein
MVKSYDIEIKGFRPKNNKWRNNMVNKRFWFGMLVMTLVFGMAVPGYVKAQTDTRLNGTWKDEFGSIQKNYSGNFETLSPNGILDAKGTYTTSNGRITSACTHIFGTSYDLDARWYSKDELGKDHPEDFESYTSKYVVNGNKLTYIDDDGEKYTFTLVSRDVKFTQTTSSGNVSSFPGRWFLEVGPRDEPVPVNMELLKDGTGIIDGEGISWKIENGRFYLIRPLNSFSSIYIVSGSTLMLISDFGGVLEYKKK